MSYVVRREQCPKCAGMGGDTSHDNLAIYSDDGGAHCHACGYTVPSKEYLLSIGKIDEEYNLVGSLFNEDIHNQLKLRAKFDPKGYRGLTLDTCKYFGVRHEYEDGKVVKQYYPVTADAEISGYKVRHEPKDFEAIGETGKACDLFGWFRFKDVTGKYCLITAGEIDQLSAYQMIRDYQVSRNTDDFRAIPVVSSTIGESGSDKQIQRYFEWFNRFDKIILCYDNDEAGKKAIDKVAKVLPKGKVFVMRLVLKDANEYLTNGKNKEFVNLFYSAEKYTPSGILASTSLMSRIEEAALTPKIPLPPFMHKLEDMMAGGIPLGVIVNLGSASGTGKSTIIDEMTYYWIFNSPHKIGVVSLESDAGQYGTKVLSRHVGYKIDLIKTPEKKLEFLHRPDIVKAAQEMWEDENGNPRWFIVDERDGDIESIKNLVNNLIISCDCRVIILDPIQDILDGLGNDEQSVFLKWMKGMVKSHNVTFINVSHVRKSSGGKQANSTGAELFEEDMQGSSSIFKSGACNLLFSRNKEAEDPIERNTTKMKATKIRWTGITGVAGLYYYDNTTHTLHDKHDWLKTNSSIPSSGVDIEDMEESSEDIQHSDDVDDNVIVSGGLTFKLED